MTSRRLPQLPLSETLVGHAVTWLHVPCWQSARLCKDKTDLVTFTPVIFSAFTGYLGREDPLEEGMATHFSILV